MPAGPLRPLRRVLVANRGEIAVRIARACRDLGLTSIAVYADDDRDAVHVRAADEAWALRPASTHGSTRPASPRPAYLDIAALLDVAARAGADAVHPGYGFGSEDPAFAAAVADAGLVWVGPSPRAMTLLGDKAAARALAARVGAPLTPGTDVADPAGVRAFAAEHGYPVLLKAVHGGGGRGMRVVRGADDVEAAWQQAVGEVTAATGRPGFVVERFLERARHVETQCLADGADVVVLGTRDCSLQRRHQKLLEECPAPGLAPQTAQQLARVSQQLLQEAGYGGAATVEFLLDETGAPAFCEVNPRIQVEHPVTELVWGVDLVAAQLRLAAGEPVAAVTAGASPRGHAIELRVTAEDAARGFAPGPGTITTWRMPSGPGVRVDAGVAEGSVVSGRYDSLLAKIVVWGASREQALARARRALTEAEVDGVPTTLAFHRAVLDHPDVAGPVPRVHTRWVDDELGALGVAPWVGTAGRAASGLGGRSAASTVTLPVEVDGRRIEVSVPAWLVATEGGGPPTDGPGPGDPTPPGDAEPDGHVVRAPLPGSVVRLCVAVGDAVRDGQVLAVLESMKLEQPVPAPAEGAVTRIDVAEGDVVDAGDPLVVVSDPPTRR